MKIPKFFIVNFFTKIIIAQTEAFPKFISNKRMKSIAIDIQLSWLIACSAFFIIFIISLAFNIIGEEQINLINYFIASIAYFIFILIFINKDFVY